MKKRIVSIAAAVTLAAAMPLYACAHSGRTDSNGGHKDNKNKSGLGSYHYHCGGNPAHLHTNGVCPYSGGSKSTSSIGNESSGIKKAEWIGDMYWDGDSFATGWQVINGKTYYFDSYGFKATYWVNNDKNNTYYLGSDGAMRTGWQKIGSSKYYFSSQGVMRTGWRKIQGHTYYMGNDGIVRTGFRKINGNVYYFDNDGKMASGWTYIGENTYYFRSNGVMLTGKYSIGGNVYEFDKNGRLME